MTVPNGPTFFNTDTAGCAPRGINWDNVTADDTARRNIRQHALDRALGQEWVDGATVRELLEIASLFANFIWAGTVPEEDEEDA